MYDAIVVGARCAGAPTAMLLARKGLRVLLVDRAGFPSDTLSTHMIHAPGVAALDRWGLLPQVIDSGAPPVSTYSFDFGHFVLRGTPQADHVGYAPRRTVLDKILVDAAVAAGTELRTGFSVTSLVVEDGAVVGVTGNDRSGTPVTERATVVIGADGRNSSVARWVNAQQYNEKPKLMRAYYSYWSGLPVSDYTTFVRPDRGFAAVPTNDGLTMLVVGWPVAEAAAYKSDVEGNYLATLDLVPSFAALVRSARREEPFLGASVPGFFRKPYGPGWALVGDAAYTKDPVTAQGISDAFASAEACAAALTGSQPFETAMATYQQSRDADVAGIYEFTAQLATLAPPPPEMQQLLAALSGNQQGADGFATVAAGLISPTTFFTPTNITRLLAA